MASRSRLTLRVEHPSGARLYWSPHHLTGHGKTPEAAREAYERMPRELAEDGLEVAVPLPPPRASSTRPHGGVDGPPLDFYFGVGAVQLRVAKKKR